MLHVIMWAALAGWVSPVILALIAGVALRLSPRFRAWLSNRQH